MDSITNMSAIKREHESEDAATKRPRVSADNTSHRLDPDLKLNTGTLMPQVMFGTYKMKGDPCHNATLSALRLGYRGVDTASVYANEKEVGAAIKESGIPRENIFIQTKLWRSFVGNTKSGKPKCDAELRKSLRNLGTSYVDMWLMHWPGPGRHLNYPPVRMSMERPKKLIEGNEKKMVPEDWTPQLRLDTYRNMTKHMGPSGIVRAVGVCNFSLRQMKDLVAFCEEHQLPLPAVLQNECHPYLIAEDLRTYCKQKGIVFQAYASLGAGSLDLMDHPVIKEIGAVYGVTPAQVLLRWSSQHGCSLLPKSVSEARQRSNFAIWDFKMSQEELQRLDQLNKAEPGQNTMVGWLSVN